jgi:serine phosphatase RsbU (regulator of sigma subunit)
VQQLFAHLDRSTAIGIAVLIAAIFLLIVLIILITVLPAQTITRALAARASEHQMVLAESLAHQAETYFNSISYELLELSSHPAIRATAATSRTAAVNQLAAVGQQYQGQIRAIVRFSSEGVPLYAWPDEYNQRIQAGQPLPWSADREWVQGIVANRSVQFMAQPLIAGGTTYLLAAPLNQATTNSEALAIELDLSKCFQEAFQSPNLSPSSQLLVFDSTGTELYHYREQPVFKTPFFPVNANATLLPNYPSEGRESVLAPIHVVSAPGGSPYLLLTHIANEGQEDVYNTLRMLFAFGIGVIGIIILFGGVLARFLLRDSNRRYQDSQRRLTIHTLLSTSRALNSSLDLDRVLDLILVELSRILPYDAASILLLNEDKETISVVAEVGEVMIEEGRDAIPLDKLPTVKEVIDTSKPIVFNNRTGGPALLSKSSNRRIQAWLGVPLRVRMEPVGILNIESYSPNRFQVDDVDLAEAFADQASIALQNARAHDFEVRTYEAELETARAIQTSLLPSEEPPIPQVEVAARAIAARQVSGDYYQYYVLPDGKLGIAVGDVSGKGIPSALLMAVITTSMREEILRTPSPAELLNELNSRLGMRMKQTNMNSALLMTLFDPVTRHLEVANAGMVQPYVFNGTRWDAVPVAGYPIGASARTRYGAKTVTLAPGSILVIVTDGIIESQNLERGLFGFDRLEAVLASVPPTSSANQIADMIVNAVRLHLAGQDPQDDMTVVIVKSIDL